jgi:hypothetical protein
MIELARPRYGHFDLGTGYHGDVWLDLDALFLRPSALRPYVGLLADRLREHRVDAVRDHAAVPVAVAALLAVGPASEIIPAALSVPFHAVDTVPSHAWLPEVCPLCGDGLPLTDPAAQGWAAAPLTGRPGPMRSRMVVMTLTRGGRLSTRGARSDIPSSTGGATRKPSWGRPRRRQARLPGGRRAR